MTSSGYESDYIIWWRRSFAYNRNHYGGSIFYRDHKDDLLDNAYCQLTAREIHIDEKEWIELHKKGNLNYDDYSKCEIKANFRGLAWSFSYNGKINNDDSTLEELHVVSQKILM